MVSITAIAAGVEYYTYFQEDKDNNGLTVTGKLGTLIFSEKEKTVKKVELESLVNTPMDPVYPLGAFKAAMVRNDISSKFVHYKIEDCH